MKAPNEQDLVQLRQSAELMMLMARQPANLETTSWAEAIDNISLMHTVTPMMDPTKYRDGLYDGTIDNIDKWGHIFRACQEFLDKINEIAPLPEAVVK